MKDKIILLHIHINESESDEKVMKKDNMPLALNFLFNRPLLLRLQDWVQMHKDSEGIKLTFPRLRLKKKVLTTFDVVLS